MPDNICIQYVIWVHDCQEEQQWPPRLLRHASGAQKQASKHLWQSESAILGRACPLVILIHRHHKNSSLLAHRGAAKAPARAPGAQKQALDCQEEQWWPPRLLCLAPGAQKQAHNDLDNFIRQVPLPSVDSRAWRQRRGEATRRACIADIPCSQCK